MSGEKDNSFWTTLPGILTGIAAIITAIGGIWIALDNGSPPSMPQDAETPNAPIVENTPQEVETAVSADMEFVRIPAGDFLMGSPPEEMGRENNEGPVHKVTIDKAFDLSKYEVTQKQWSEVMGTNPSQFNGENLPVEQVSWNDVQTFIKKLNENSAYKYRLPSEAEWEYACRAGSTTAYYFGDDESILGNYAWYDANSNKTHPVGQKEPNSLGLYDMHGNVKEWVQDRFHNNYNGAPSDGSAWENADTQIRVTRGGSWRNPPERCRSSFRGQELAESKPNNVGFRLLREV